MTAEVNKIFRAVADPTRREIFHILIVAGAALSITQISEYFEMSRQGVTKHIRLLEEAGLVQISKNGRERYCYVNPDPLGEIKNWARYYEEFWTEKLDKLGKHLNS